MEITSSVVRLRPFKYLQVFLVSPTIYPNFLQALCYIWVSGDRIFSVIAFVPIYVSISIFLCHICPGTGCVPECRDNTVALWRRKRWDSKGKLRHREIPLPHPTLEIYLWISPWLSGWYPLIPSLWRDSRILIFSFFEPTYDFAPGGLDFSALWFYCLINWVYKVKFLISYLDKFFLVDERFHCVILYLICTNDMWILPLLLCLKYVV